MDLDDVDAPADEQPVSRLLRLAAAIEDWKYCVCKIECGAFVQDANHVGDIQLNLSNASGTWPVHIRPIWFGNMITFIDEHNVIDSEREKTLKNLFVEFGYVYVPHRILRKQYPRTDYRTWFERFFSW